MTSREIKIHVNPSVSIEQLIEIFQPSFDIVIRGSSHWELVSKKKVATGEGFVNSSFFQEQTSLAKKRKKGIQKFNSIESKAINGLIEGKTYNEIAEDIGININNLRYYIKKIYRILGVNSAREAVRVYKETFVTSND